MQAIHKQLLAKADVAVVEEHAIGALDTLRNRVDELSHVIDAASQFGGSVKDKQRSKPNHASSLADRFHSVEGGVSSVEADCAQLQRSLAQLQTQVKEKADRAALQKKSNKVDCEKRAAVATKSIEDQVVKSTAWQNVARKHLQKLEADAQRARKQLAVVLKFIDWFSDVKLRGATNPSFGD